MVTVSMPEIYVRAKWQSSHAREICEKLADLLQRRKPIHQVDRQSLQQVKEDHNADQHQQRPGDDLHRSEMTFDETEGADQVIEQDSSQYEWNAESGRIEGQQNYALRYILLLCSQCQNSRKDRTDARSPAKGKGHTDQDRTNDAEFLLPGVEALLIVEKTNTEYPRNMEAKDEDDHSGHFAEDIFVFEDIADLWGYRAKKDEDQRETDHKEDCIEYQFPIMRASLLT